MFIVDGFLATPRFYFHAFNSNTAADQKITDHIGSFFRELPSRAETLFCSCQGIKILRLVLSYDLARGISICVTVDTDLVRRVLYQKVEQVIHLIPGLRSHNRCIFKKENVVHDRNVSFLKPDKFKGNDNITLIIEVHVLRRAIGLEFYLLFSEAKHLAD